MTRTSYSTRLCFPISKTRGQPQLQRFTQLTTEWPGWAPLRTIFNAVRSVLDQSQIFKEYWSYAALYAIYRGKYLPPHRKNGAFVIPNFSCFPKGAPPSYPPSLDQNGHIVNTNPIKRKLADKPTTTRYLRAITATQYLVLLPSRSTRVIRAAVLILILCRNSKADHDKGQPQKAPPVVRSSPRSHNLPQPRNRHLSPANARCPHQQRKHRQSHVNTGRSNDHKRGQEPGEGKGKRASELAHRIHQPHERAARISCLRIPRSGAG